MTSCDTCGTLIPDDATACPNCPADAAGDDRTLAGRPTDNPPPDELFHRVHRELAGDYEVHAELGRGGMAVVYRATELELLRPVALKVLPPELAASAAMSERFRREARLAASFDHPNIIPIYRVGQAGGVFFIAMKYVEGRPLDDLITAQGALPIPVVMHVLRAASRALAFAHQNGVIHRDIKGANILVDQDGRVVVSDFGIARAGEDAGLTATGMLMGTPYFMSPEQCAGHRVSQQSDQYSLGVVAFQMLTGTVPFHADTIPGVMQHHFFTPVPDMAAVRSDIPPGLMEIVQRAMAKRAADRFATTLEMQQAIEALPFDETSRRHGETMLRDLVLGVALPKVHTGKLPPLQDTLLMTPPAVVRQRAVTGRRRRLAAGVAATLVIGSAMGYQVFAGSGAAGDGAANAGPGSSIAAGSPPLSQQGVTAPVVPTRPEGAAASDSAPRLATASERAFARGEAAATPSAPAASRSTPDRAAAVPEAPAPEPGAVPGKLRVRVVPGDAEILVDGQLLGRGVVLDSAIASGRRRLRITAPGYLPLDTVIAVAAGATSQVGTVRLTPEGRP